jgi:hydroxymethylbilane synthase
VNTTPLNRLVIGTRGSKLALWQAEFVKARLENITDIPVSLEIIKTQGDRIQDKAFSEMNGQNFFAKELEEKLLDKSIDLAVHSLKDLMTSMPEGLTLAAAGFREDNREAIIIRKESFDPNRPLKIRQGGTIGSSSVRRQCQIAALSPDLIMKDLRGNVPTRIGKLRDGEYDAIIIAHAGIKRLGLDLSDLEVFLQSNDRFYPAPGQGILGIQTRADDSAVNSIIGQLDDPVARIEVELERGLLARFQGGCQLPLGVYSEIDGDNLAVHAVLGKKDNGSWTGLARASARGREVKPLIEEVYQALTTDAG